MRFFMLREKRLFELLSKHSAIVSDAAQELKSFINGYSKLERSERKLKVQEIKKFENNANEFYLGIFLRLKKKFASDREEIGRIVLLLNEIAKLIGSTSSRFVILGVERIDEYILKFADLTYNFSAEVNKCISNLKNAKSSKEYCSKIHHLKR